MYETDSSRRNMRILTTVLSIEALTIVGTVTVVLLSSELGRWTSIVMALLWLASGLAVWLVRCPTCGKPVLVREGSFVNYSLPIPEAVCSRCGTRLIGSDTHTSQGPK